MKLLNKKNILIALLVVIILGVGYQYSYLVVPVEFKDYGDWIEEKPRSAGEIQRYNDALVEAYENDFFGGETPEETLGLWVEAVKEDDLEKASLYFLVDARREALESMKISRENKVLPDVIEDIENGGKWYENEYTGARFDTASEEETREGYIGFELEFIKNPYTNIWKLEKF